MEFSSSSYSAELFFKKNLCKCFIEFQLAVEFLKQRIYLKALYFTVWAAFSKFSTPKEHNSCVKMFYCGDIFFSVQGDFPIFSLHSFYLYFDFSNLINFSFFPAVILSWQFFEVISSVKKLLSAGLSFWRSFYEKKKIVHLWNFSSC